MLNQKTLVSLLSVVFVILSQRCANGEGGCPQSIPTLNEADACPKTITEWIKAKERKQCYLISQNCTTKKEFEYHCLPNTVTGLFVELCAPPKVIVGYHCPIYDMERNTIEANFNEPCKDHLKPCEEVYKSNSAYKYQDCFTGNNIKTANNNAAPIIISNDYTALMIAICIFLCVVVGLLLIQICCPGYCKRLFHCKIRKRKAKETGTGIEGTALQDHMEDSKENPPCNGGTVVISMST